MAVDRKTVGTGITARGKITYSGEDIAIGFEELARRWSVARAAAGSDFGADVLNVERSCRRIMESAGSGPFAADSVEDYAKRILIAIRQTKACIARQEAENAARCALTVGRLITEANIKGRWEPHALRGKKNASVLKGATSRTNEKRSAEAKQQYATWQAMADKSWELNPHLSNTDVGEIIAAKLGGNSGTIRRKISKK